MRKKADEVFREGRRIPHERRWIPYSPSELAQGIANLFRPRRTEAREPEPLDKFGLPLSWRHDEFAERTLQYSSVHWGLFEMWCDQNGRTAFPADAYTCLNRHQRGELARGHRASLRAGGPRLPETRTPPPLLYCNRQAGLRSKRCPCTRSGVGRGGIQPALVGFWGKGADRLPLSGFGSPSLAGQRRTEFTY
ncbi:hypothetical protein BH20ACT23_BH20ACT23_15200 [soil metagenome]